jgi:hypothetical protein
LIQINLLINCINIRLNFHLVPIEREIEQAEHLGLILVGIQIMEFEGLVLILLILILLEIRAIKIKQAVTQLVTCHGFDLQAKTE